MRKSKMGLVYILPWLIGMIFLTLYPFINALVISFTDYNLVREPNFIPDSLLYSVPAGRKRGGGGAVEIPVSAGRAY